MENGTRPGLTPEQKQELAKAILLLRYVGHEVAASVSTSIAETLIRTATYHLELAKAAGIKDEYLKLILTNPILKVTVEEYAEWGNTIFVKKESNNLKLGQGRKRSGPSQPDDPRTGKSQPARPGRKRSLSKTQEES